MQMPHTPHTPHTPGNAGGNSGPPSVAAASVGQDTSGNNLNTSTGSGIADTSDIIASDLNFDPTTVIDTDASTEALNVSIQLFFSFFIFMSFKV